MTTTARSIIEKAHTQLSDSEGVRWPAYELVGWLNEAQRVIVRERPDQKCTTQPISLAFGFRHTIPDDAVALMDIPNNSAGNKRRITKIDMDLLDNVAPAWRAMSSSTEVRHFMHDMREPRVFQVYPPAAIGAQVDVTYSLEPVDVPVPVDGWLASAVTGNIDLRGTWADPILNFVLFKAYSKDAEFGGNANLAANYLALFNAALGTQLQTSATVAPKS